MSALNGSVHAARALKRPAVMCFGESLWDHLPHAVTPGGAPLNVAYHLGRLGARAHIVSAVGRDARGDELLRRVRDWGLEIGGIASHLQAPTGSVQVDVSAGGDVRFEIAADVAWDRIACSEESLRLLPWASALVFGSLALRSIQNRMTLRRLLSQLRPDAERVFDVNLRAPFDDLALVRQLAPEATVLKMNLDEAARIVGASHGPDRIGSTADALRGLGAVEHLARVLEAEFGPPTICITAGSQGAGLLDNGEWFWEPGGSVKVADPVGAGDAFLAALLMARLQRRSSAEQLAAGCRLGEWVASKTGATPAYEGAL